MIEGAERVQVGAVIPAVKRYCFRQGNFLEDPDPREPRAPEEGSNDSRVIGQSSVVLERTVGVVTCREGDSRQLA